MYYRIREIAFVFVLSGLVATPSLAQRAAALPQDVESYVRRYVDEGSGVGMAIAMVTADGTRYFSYGTTGGNSPRPIDERSVFEIGSITKTFTGVVLADMHLSGVLHLDDPVARYLPDGVTVPSRGGGPITLAHLATQMSGLPRLPDNLDPADAANPYADYLEEDLYTFLASHSLRRAPGDEWEYSNLGFGLLGHALARANETTYEQLIVERIATPLGMRDTRVRLLGDVRDRLAYGYSGGRHVANWEFSIHAGAGALVSTSADMARYVAAAMGEGDGRLAAAMTLATSQRHAEVAGTMGVGLAWLIGDIGDGVPVVWHNGGTGGYRSFAGFNSDRRIGVVVLSNTDESVDPIGFRLLGGDVPLSEVRVAVDVPAAVLERYVGEYRLTPTFTMTVRHRDGRLTIQGTGQGEIPVLPSSETEFYATVIDASVSFEVNEVGAVTALILHQGGADHRAPKENE